MEPRPPHLTRRRLLGASATVLGMVAVPACTEGPTDRKATEPLSAGVEIIAEGLDVPWSIAFHEGTALVSERDSARVLEILDGGAHREAGKVAGVEARGEGGLLGIAVHEGFLYSYATTSGDNRIERRPLTGSPGAIGLGEPETLLTGIPAAAYHNGGRLAFGPDGLLYATVGDAGDRESAQDPGALSGSILRLTPDGGVPADNPFPGAPVYSYGHRNPQGIAWGDDGTLYASEFGQDTWDELNVIRAGGDYGWPDVEGIEGDPEYVDPVQQWTPDEASPSGIAVAAGAVHIANLRGERLRSVPLGDLATSTERLAGEHGRLRDVVLAPDGSLWVLTSNTDGRGDPADGDDRILRLPAVG